MGDPVTATLITMTVISAATAVVTGVSGYLNAQAQADQADADADAARKAGEVRAVRAERQQRRQRGLARATAGAQGIDVNVGTPLDIEEDQLREDQQDLALIRMGADTEATRLEAQGDFARAQGTASLIEGVGGAATTVLGAKLQLAQRQEGITRHKELMARLPKVGG